ncbi:HlyD family type I secretion periplasmic adaptor subunit [Sulfuricurvum sp.]|uniref:HlyD family type I secretion periplasmic adaptor subunit n=1 Tax=Sulfuricurvum sp. TaxID=2025608 RepID=UPI0026198264|nr:HlyD family type I secretion periplasmic adaptor subunit [Sulfuricurvum sp.]MDD2267825.1 HlyD family type I secretion periplasmic adaptor subunit [Sulfuricurvum sp.]MDD2784371.1 HlyD family type I secretion periplasmic adaptor subunit [Sulfuricurvum sp.]
MKNNTYDERDLQYMSSLSEAILQKAPSASKKLIWLVSIAIAWLIIWASIADIDEITRGQGKIIPSQQLQVVQNLEGGIVSEILVKEGDFVKKGQVLLKIDDKNFASSYGESKLRYVELKAKQARLEAEANDLPFEVPANESEDLQKQLKYEKSFYDSNKEQIQKTLQIFEEQIGQRENELKELEAKVAQMQRGYDLVTKEIKIMEPLTQKGLVSEVEFLQLRRQANAINGDLQAARLSIPRIKSTKEEAEKKKSEAILGFKNRAKKELNEAVAEMSRLTETQTSLEDRVKRTLVRAPMDGTIKQLLVNTVSGVVKPGMDILEIVPAEDTLLVEAKVKPSDVAYLVPGLKAMVKFTAYDFSIYGGLKGKLTFISADTLTNEKGESYYVVHIKTDKNFLGDEKKPLPIMVGMTVTVDILTGKKTVLDYLLKPILKAKQNALRER